MDTTTLDVSEWGTEMDNQVPVYDPEVVIYKKVLAPSEEEVLARCKRAIEKYTGEKFTSGIPKFLVDRNIHITFDCYSDRMKIALEYNVARYTNDTLEGLRPFPHMYIDMQRCVANTFQTICSVKNIAIIYVGTEESITDPDGYILKRLHELTRYRPFVGMPKCACGIR